MYRNRIVHEFRENRVGGIYPLDHSKKPNKNEDKKHCYSVAKIDEKKNSQIKLVEHIRTLMGYGRVWRKISASLF